MKLFRMEEAKHAFKSSQVVANYLQAVGLLNSSPKDGITAVDLDSNRPESLSRTHGELSAAVTIRSYNS